MPIYPFLLVSLMLTCLSLYQSLDTSIDLATIEPAAGERVGAQSVSSFRNQMLNGRE